MLKEAKRYCVAYGDACDRRNDDLIAAGNLGLAEAIDRFNLNRNNGLAAFAKPIIRGWLKETSKSFNRNGWAGETRLQRAVYGNHDLTVEQASKVMKRPVDEGEIERARTEVLGMCSPLLPYDTTEPAFEDDDEDEEGKPCLVAVAPPCPRLQELDAKLIMRHGWLSDGCGNSRGRKFGVHLVEEADRRARQRLKQIGRRAYALELVAKGRPGAIKHLFEPRRRPTAPIVNSYWTADKPDRELKPPPPMPTLFTLMRGGWQPFVVEPELWPGRAYPSDGQWSAPGTESYHRWRSIYATWCGQPALLEMIEVSPGRFVNSISAARLGLQQCKPAALALAA